MLHYSITIQGVLNSSRTNLWMGFIHTDTKCLKIWFDPLRNHQQQVVSRTKISIRKFDRNCDRRQFYHSTALKKWQFKFFAIGRQNCASEEIMFINLCAQIHIRHTSYDQCSCSISRIVLMVWISKTPRSYTMKLEFLLTSRTFGWFRIEVEQLHCTYADTWFEICKKKNNDRRKYNSSSW